MGIKGILVTVSLVLSILIGVVIGRGHGATNSGGSGGTGQSAGGKQLVIGLSLDTLKEERWQRDRDNFVARCKELGAEVRVQSANSDDAIQVKDVNGLLASGCDVMVIAPHNGQAMAIAVKACNDKGVPCIAYDRLIKDCNLDLYMTFDNFNVGRIQGKFIVDQLAKLGKKPMKLVRIYGAKTDNNALLFKQGQDEALKPHIDAGEIQVIAEDWADDWKPENAKRIMSAALTKTKDIDAVLASNDGTAGGAIQALSEEGLAGKTIVTGQDAEVVACQRIVQGTQSMTVYKPLKALASRAAEVAVAMAKGKTVVANAEYDNGQVKVPSISLDVEIVTKANMDDTIIKDNFHTRDEVYAK